MEVKTTLKGHLKEALLGNIKVRKMAEEGKKFYEVVLRHNNAQGKPVVSPFEVTSEVPLSPRFFIFAYSSGWKKADTAIKNIKSAYKTHTGAFCHGLYILDLDIFVMREAFTSNIAIERGEKAFGAFLGHVTDACEGMLNTNYLGKDKQPNVDFTALIERGEFVKEETFYPVRKKRYF